jgi:hypothetical protein
MLEPFRCLTCGSRAAAATRCGTCAGTTFGLVRPRDLLSAPRTSDDRGAEPIPIERARFLRLRRRGAALR